MKRIRTIKPELREWAPFACLTDGAARLFLMLYTLADDEGRCPAGASYLAGAVFFGRQRSPAVVGRLLAELEDAALVFRYEVKGAPFVEIAEWSVKGSPTYQFIKKPHPHRYPAPTLHAESPRKSRSEYPPESPEHEQDHEQEQERERKGASGSAVPRLATDSAASVFSEHYARANGGNAPTWNTRNRKRLADLVIEHGAPEVERRIRIMFTSPPKWPPPPYDFATLVSHFDRFASPTNGRANISKFTDDDYLAPSPAFPNMVNANDFGGPEDPC